MCWWCVHVSSSNVDRIFRSTGLLQLVKFLLCGSGRSLKLLDGTLPVEYAHCVQAIGDEVMCKQHSVFALIFGGFRL